ncbi:hypothetical protein Patl1_26193 [Pistacia atlantica]|uniref:Uncharacterized protein n=2 Tax=Pistacia TaxID=55512 RepID=A0ACC1B0N1_9ROSI|nr:hypothetical protein Patl1_26193 [Pistacia atlantica]
METEKVVSKMEELPKNIVRRVVKDKLNECSPDTTSPSTKTPFSLSPKAPLSLSSTSPPWLMIYARSQRGKLLMLMMY